MSTKTASPTSRVELIQGLVDDLNRHDVQAAKHAWTSESVFRFPDGVRRGADAIADYFEQFVGSMFDWHMEVMAMIEQGDELFFRWHVTGHHTGPLFGLAATRKPLTIDGMDHMVIRDGAVVSNFVVSDQLDPARQLGLMPPAGSFAENAMKRAFNVRTRLMSRRTTAVIPQTTRLR